jgi:hypothetical protein
MTPSVNRFTLPLVGAAVFFPAPPATEREREALPMMIRRGDATHRRDWRRCQRLFGSSLWKGRADSLAWIYDCGNHAAWAAVAASVVLFLYAVVYAFPNARLAALQQAREVVEQENRAFCEKHGMPFGTKSTRCAQKI